MSRAAFALGASLTLATGGAAAQAVLSPTRNELNLEVDHAAEVLRGSARIVAEDPSTEPVGQASLAPYRLLQVRSVRDDQGKDLSFSLARFSAHAQPTREHLTQRSESEPRRMGTGSATAARAWRTRAGDSGHGWAWAPLVSHTRFPRTD